MSADKVTQAKFPCAKGLEDFDFAFQPSIVRKKTKRCMLQNATHPFDFRKSNLRAPRASRYAETQRAPSVSLSLSDVAIPLLAGSDLPSLRFESVEVEDITGTGGQDDSTYGVFPNICTKGLSDAAL